MRTHVLIALSLLCVGAAAVSAQGPASPPASAAVTIGGKAITIQYSAPSVRGRQIFGAGGLLSQDPTYPVWRAGANDATTLKTDAVLTLGGITVPRGTYSLYVVVRDPSAWELIINKQTGQSGLDYDARQDLGRVKMAMSRPPSLVERLTYTLSDRGSGNGELRLEWEQHVGVVAFVAR